MIITFGGGLDEGMVVEISTVPLVLEILPLHAEGGQVEQAGLVLDKDEEQLARMFSWGFNTVLTNLKK